MHTLGTYVKEDGPRTQAILNESIRYNREVTVTEIKIELVLKRVS